MKVTIIDSGYAGLVIGACQAETDNDVFCLNVDPKKIDILNWGGWFVFARRLLPYLLSGLFFLQGGVADAGSIEFNKREPSVRPIRTVHIVAGSPYSVSGHNDIALIRRYYHGASWETPIAPETWDRLKPLGIDDVRLINVERSESTRRDSVSGALSFDFSNLAFGLADCKEYGLVPHIVVGQRPQEALASGQANAPYGVFNTQEYEEYAYALLRFVVVNEGFSQADFEVSNEPDINGASWLLPGRQPNGSIAMYEAYLGLYTAWAHAVTRLLKEYPLSHVRLGGPAITPYTLAYGRVDWAKQFIQDISARQLPLNFFSFHVYGDQDALSGVAGFGPYPSFADRVAYYQGLLRRAGLNGTQLYVTEWGPSSTTDDGPKGIVNGNEIGAAWAAKFLIDMVDAGVNEGMLLVLRDERSSDPSVSHWGWPAFLLSDGRTRKPLFNTALAFSKMARDRIRVRGDSESMRVIASEDVQRITIIAAKYDWDYQRLLDRTSSEQVRFVIEHMPIQARQVCVTRYLIDAGHSNALRLQSGARSLDAGRGQLEKVDELIVPVIARRATLPNTLIPPSSVTFLQITDICSAR